MKCGEFLARFSEFYDERAEPGVDSDMEAHAASCSRCRRYIETLEEGVRLIRELPAPELPRDFRDRLMHRIYHVEDGAAIARERLGTGATTGFILAVAALMAAVAWAPTVGDSPGVELPALVVSRPALPPARQPRAVPTFSRSHRLSVFTSSEFEEGMWGDPHRLLFRYSTISDRRPEGFPTRLGLQ